MGQRESVFCCLSSGRMAKRIADARARVCYVAPGVQDEVARAICSAVARNPKVRVSVSIDFDERVLRMGYGSLKAVQLLKDGGIDVVNSPGLRAAVLIVDDDGWVFTPTALYLEKEPQSEETPNAVRLTGAQVEGIALRISPMEREVAIAEADTVEDREQAENIVQEIGNQPVSQAEFDVVTTSLQQAPPVNFDIVRQVRVFEPYLQYVDLSLRGAAVQRRRIKIPRSLMRLGTGKDLEGRLRAIFDLIERDDQLSSKTLENDLNEIRKDFTRALGDQFGRVMLKSARVRLDQRVAELRLRLEKHQEEVEKGIEEKLKKSRELVVEYYLPAARKTPPDELIGGSVNPKLDEVAIRNWIETKLATVFPSARDVVSKMSLAVSFKDVTFETLNNPEFMGLLMAAYPGVDWDKPYKDFRAMGEESKETVGVKT